MTNARTTYNSNPLSTTRDYIDAYEAHDLIKSSHRIHAIRALILLMRKLSRERKHFRDFMFANRVYKISNLSLVGRNESLVCFLRSCFNKRNPTKIARRAAYLGIMGEIWKHEEEISRLKACCAELNLTDANTRLAPEPAYVTAWYESCRREDEQQRLFAKNEQVARRRIRRRTMKSADALPVYGTTRLPVSSEA